MVMKRLRRLGLALMATTAGLLALACGDGKSQEPAAVTGQAQVDGIATTVLPTPPVRTATPTGTAAPPTLVPTPAIDYAGIVLASGNVREDAATVLREGERVELTCHEAAAWERPTMAEMSERFTFYRFGNGEHPFPGLYAYHLADVLYQEMPWASSANIEFYSMSGLNGGNDSGRAAPGLCPPRAHSEDISTAPQAIFFAGLRPLAILELGGHAVVVVEADDGVLHKIAFERLICCAGKAGPFPFERLDVVTVGGQLRYVESGQERWQADAAGAVEFAVTGDVVGELPHDLPLPDPFVAYDAHDPGWQTIEVGFLPAGATVGSHAEDPERIEMRMLFLPAGSRIP